MAYTTIDKPSDYFNTVLWTGDSTASRNITGVGFQPDWVWQKCRSHAVPHLIYDSVRGAGNDKELSSNSTAAEGGQSAETDGFMSAFISDGFTVEDGSGGNTHYVNLSGRTFTAWNWLAGGTAVTNNDGATASSVSANPTAGFSVITHTGTGSATNFGHGLNQTPELVITKSRTLVGGNWDTWHKSFTATQVVRLQTTAGKTTSSTSYGTVPDSSVIYVGTSNHTNQSGQSILTYAFHSVKGYSKFGSYTGNGNADGPFIYTGFKPAMIIWKQTNTTRSWYMMDNKRNTFNVTNNFLRPDTNAAESTAANSIADFLSNGFKLRGNGADVNASGGTYIYMAFAENPFVTSTGIPTTAR